MDPIAARSAFRRVSRARLRGGVDSRVLWGCARRTGAPDRGWERLAALVVGVKQPQRENAPVALGAVLRSRCTGTILCIYLNLVWGVPRYGCSGTGPYRDRPRRGFGDRACLDQAPSSLNPGPLGAATSTVHR